MIRELLEYREVGTGEKIAFVVLLSLARGKPPGDVTDATYASLAAQQGCCSSLARRRAHGLERARLIEITRDDFVLGFRILATPLAEACRAGP